jgi:hypothetical protein
LKKSEISNEQLLDEIKKNYDMAIITLDDMTKIIYTKNRKINSKDLNELKDLGLLGVAYKYNNNNIIKLEWLKKNSTYSVVEGEEKDNDTNIILHYTLIKDRAAYSKLSLREVLKDV